MIKPAFPAFIVGSDPCNVTLTQRIAHAKAVAILFANFPGVLFIEIEEVLGV
jgi:hypothetical protein